MTRQFRTHASIALLSALGVWLGSTAIVSAQTVFDQPPVFDDVRQNNERDPIFGNSDLNMMELIHRANLLGNRSLAEYISNQEAQIQGAAANFRALQLQRLHQTEAIDTPSALSLDLSE